MSFATGHRVTELKESWGGLWEGVMAEAQSEGKSSQMVILA